MESGTRRLLEASRRDSIESDQDTKQDSYRGGDISSMDGTGTVLVRSPSTQTSSIFNDQGTMSSSMFSSLEDVSISGTFVYHGQHDDSDSLHTPNSRPGIQEKTSTASHEDIALNLAEAKAAIQGGMKKGHAKDKSGLSKVNKTVESTNSLESATGHSSNYYDAIKAFPKPRHASSDEEESIRSSASSPSAPHSILIVPSLEEAVANDLEASMVRSVINL